MSWSPRTGLVYLPATNNNYYFEKAEDFEYRAGRWNTGINFSSENRPERPALQGPGNVLLAWDPAREPRGVARTGPAVATAARWRPPGTSSSGARGRGWPLWTRGAGKKCGRRRSAPTPRHRSPTKWTGGSTCPIAAGLSSLRHRARRVWSFALDADASGDGQDLTTAAPEDVGLSSEVMARIGPTMRDFIGNGVARPAS